MKSVRNAMRALSLFSEDSPEISVSHVSEQLKIPMSSASRLLASMTECGLIEQNPPNRLYSLGPLISRLGSLRAGRTSTSDVLRGAMQSLAAESRHSCWLSSLQGSDAVVLDGIHGGYPIRLIVDPGSRLPAHASAAGKALLARLKDDRVASLFSNTKLSSQTNYTITHTEDLMNELRQIRQKMWAQIDQELIEGIKSLAVAICPRNETTLYALSISFPIANVSAEEEAFMRRILLQTGKRTGQVLGDLLWDSWEKICQEKASSS